MPCLGRRTGDPAAEVETALDALAETVRVVTSAGRCMLCFQEQTIFSLFASAPSPKPSTPRPALNGTLWRYLSEHRGEMFCAHCLASAILSRGRIDRALMSAEGRGALRRHASCSRCGENRLVCGLAAV